MHQDFYCNSTRKITDKTHFMGKYFLAHLSSVLQYVQYVRSNWMSCRYWSQLPCLPFSGLIYLHLLHLRVLQQNRVKHLPSRYLVFSSAVQSASTNWNISNILLIIMIISSMKKNIQNAFFFNGQYVHKFKPKRFFVEISLFSIFPKFIQPFHHFHSPLTNILSNYLLSKEKNII